MYKTGSLGSDKDRSNADTYWSYSRVIRFLAQLLAQLSSWVGQKKPILGGKELEACVAIQADTSLPSPLFNDGWTYRCEKRLADREGGREGEREGEREGGRERGRD